jgi:hypothetical protein
MSHAASRDINIGGFNTTILPFIFNLGSADLGLALGSSQLGGSSDLHLSA